MHSKSDNMEIMIIDEADEVIKKFFDLLKNSHQNSLKSMKGLYLIMFSYCIINAIK